MRLALEQAVDGADDYDLTHDKARRVIVGFVERVIAPVEAEVPLPNGMTKRCRAARVKLKLPLQDGTTRILAPLYDPRHKGARVLLDRE